MDQNNNSPGGQDGLGDFGDVLANVGSFVTGGLVGDAQNHHQGILADAVKCLFGHDPWAAESWAGAVKNTPPSQAHEPDAGRPSYAASKDERTGVNPAKSALATVAATDTERARGFNAAPGQDQVTTVSPGLSVAGGPVPGDSGARRPDASEAAGIAAAQSYESGLPKDAAPTATAHPDASPPASPANSAVAITADARAKAMAASRGESMSVYNAVPDPGKPQIWTNRSDLDRMKPQGALSPKREAIVQATGGRPGPVTMSAPAAPAAFWQIYKGSGLNTTTPATTTTGTYKGADANAKVVPNDANFATPETFGEPGTNLVKYSTSSGQSINVNAKVAGNFQGFTSELERAGYHIKPGESAGFSNRQIANSTRMSQHSLGNAVDINWDDNTVKEGGRNTLPPNVAQIAAKYGLSWGGTWRKQDTMHFEYNSVHGVPMRPLTS